jgi:hypothetical protein
MATPPAFSVGQVLTSATMNAVGLWRVGGGTLSSTATNFQSVFTDDFRDYIIVVDSLQMSNTNSLFYRLLDGSTQRTTGYAWAFTGYTSAAGGANSHAASEARGFTGFAHGGANNQIAGGFIMNVLAPKISARTFIYSQSTSIESSIFVSRQGMTVHDSVVSNDGIRFETNSAVTIGGNVSIYGYNP